jgi:hypothetical protein
MPACAAFGEQVVDNHVTAASVEGVDSLILLSAKFDKDSIPASGRLALVARFGVG